VKEKRRVDKMMRNGSEEGRRPKDGNEAQEQVDERSLLFYLY
jgi:hypothetical protein